MTEIKAIKNEKDEIDEIEKIINKIAEKSNVPELIYKLALNEEKKKVIYYSAITIISWFITAMIHKLLKKLIYFILFYHNFYIGSNKLVTITFSVLIFLLLIIEVLFIIFSFTSMLLTMEKILLLKINSKHELLKFLKDIKENDKKELFCL